MASEVEICNMALGLVGVSQTITSLDESSNEARQCKRFFAPDRDVVLRDFPWPFAKRYESLGLIAENPNDEWGYSYRYPSDCLRAIAIVTGTRNDPNPPAFTLANDNTGILIYTDQKDAVLRYTYRYTNTDFLDPSFTLSLAWLIGSHVGIPLARSPKLVDRALKNYTARILLTQAIGLNEEQADKEPESEIIRSRA